MALIPGIYMFMSATCKLEAEGNRRTESDGFGVEAAQGQVTYCMEKNRQLFPTGRAGVSPEE